MPAVQSLLKINEAMTPSQKIRVIDETIRLGIEAYQMLSVSMDEPVSD